MLIAYVHTTQLPTSNHFVKTPINKTRNKLLMKWLLLSKPKVMFFQFSLDLLTILDTAILS